MENTGSTRPADSMAAVDGAPPKRYSEPSNEASKRESQQWKERGRQSHIFEGQNDTPQKSITKTWKNAGRHCEIFDEKYNAPLKTPQRNWPWQEKARRSSILGNSENASNQNTRYAAVKANNRQSSPTKEGGDASNSPSRPSASPSRKSGSPSRKSDVDALDSTSQNSVAGDASELSPRKSYDEGDLKSPSRKPDATDLQSAHKWPWQEKALVSDIFGYQPTSRYSPNSGKFKKDYAWNQTKCTHDFGGNYSANDRFQRGPNLGVSNTQEKNLKKGNQSNGHDH